MKRSQKIDEIIKRIDNVKSVVKEKTDHSEEIKESFKNDADDLISAYEGVQKVVGKIESKINPEDKISMRYQQLIDCLRIR